MNNLRNEVENNLKRFKDTYGDESYCISLASKKETLNKCNKIKKLGYTVTKSEHIQNHYTISR